MSTIALLAMSLVLFLTWPAIQRVVQGSAFLALPQQGLVLPAVLDAPEIAAWAPSDPKAKVTVVRDEQAPRTQSFVSTPPPRDRSTDRPTRDRPRRDRPDRGDGGGGGGGGNDGGGGGNNGGGGNGPAEPPPGGGGSGPSPGNSGNAPGHTGGSGSPGNSANAPGHATDGGAPGNSGNAPGHNK